MSYTVYESDNVKNSIREAYNNRQTFLRCKKCANIFNCHAFIPNCGAFTPKQITFDKRDNR